MRANKLATDKNTNNLSTYTTAAIQPGVNRLVLAFVMNIRATNALDSIPALKSNGLVWQVVKSVQVPGNPDRRLTCLRAMTLGPAPPL